MAKRKAKVLLPAFSLLSVATISAVGLASCGPNGVDPYNIDFTLDIAGTTIDFWTGFGSDMQDALETVVEQFEEETGVIVNLESKGGYDQLASAINLSSTSGNMPHLAVAYPDHMASYVSNNSIVRLDYYFENDGDDNFNIQDFYSDYMVENQSVEFKDDGTPWTLGVPFNKSTEIMSYNKTFFDWAKTIDDTIKVPSTWAEVRSVGVAINNMMTDYYGKYVGKDGIAYDSTVAMEEAGTTQMFDFRAITADLFHPISYDSQSNFFITVCRQWGGTYTELDKETLKGYVAFDSAEMIEAMTFMKEAHAEDSLAIPQDYQLQGYSSNAFKTLQSVVNIGSSAGVKNSCPPGDKFEVGVAPIPYKDADKKFVISQGTNLILLDTGLETQRLAAWTLLKYLAKEHNGEFAASSGYFPSSEYAFQSDAYQELVEMEPVSTVDKAFYATTMVNTNTYMNDTEGWTKFVDPPFVGSSTIRATVESAFSRVFIGNETPEAVLDSLYSQLGDYVR